MRALDIDRQGLSALLGPYLAGGKATDDADRRLVAGAGTIKTYTVESDRSEPVAELLARAFHPLDAEVAETADAELWVVLGERLTLFVDTLDPRFWIVHTASSSVQAKKALRR